MEHTGLLHLYYGDGKGKTTAAMGLALRAMGSGKRVVILQFLKGGKSGEVPLLEQLGAKVYSGKAGQKFVFQMTPEEKAAYCPCCAAVDAGCRRLCHGDEVPPPPLPEGNFRPAGH